MTKRCDDKWDALQARVTGLGERSFRKSYYPKLKEKLSELERFKALLDLANDMIFLIDAASGRLVYASRAICVQLGYSHEELLDMKFSDMLPAEVSPLMADLRGRNLGDGGSEVLTTRLAVRDGREVPVEITLSIVTFQKVLYFVAVARDITRRKRNEEKIARQNEFLEGIMESLSHPFRVIDANDYTIKMANSAAAPEGFTPDLTCFELTHGRDTPCNDPKYGCPVEIVKRTRRAMKTEHTRYDAKGNARHFEIQAYPIFDGDGNVVQIVEYFMDVTERRTMEDALRVANDQLELRVRERTAELRSSNEALKQYSAKLERVNEELQGFVHIASHDLQEPLRKIQTFCDLAKKGFEAPCDKDAEQYLDRAMSSASRMRQLLNDLLQFSKLATTGQPFKEINLGKVAREAAGLFNEHLVELGGLIEIGNMPEIEADEGQMLLLFVNLIDNALKFRSKESPRIKIYAKQDPWLCEIFIEDNGAGFGQQFAERIFKPFQKLHSRLEYQGTGMGLAMCRRIVERHGGNIRAQSEPGRGSTIVIGLHVKYDGWEGIEDLYDRKRGSTDSSNGR
ncbi:putative Histidine kinase [Syntrophobacter sp. SbD1]|nr:putative Histidine kinase [Syntrophobacter sp. SbD1]